MTTPLFPPPPPQFQFPVAALGRTLWNFLSPPGVKGHGMEQEMLGALVILGVLSLARGNPPDAANPFQYDWCHLRVGGLVVAAVLSVVGIIVLFTAAAPPRSCHLWPGKEPPPPAELSPKCPQSLPEKGDE
ncbi:FXYD domain-containing ion transport regulator 3-like isoform X2 [Hirundo rustica]|uniref:FXYD domain-containing ion transport regulator 3-like isoform X2 n=1 Tax=Hirundo rustica TaxID=43150 RepID=UPI001A949E9A|nr:FXYD domain-containing ion transport regulator 3-like isoform X2 [Hirundo rustica]